MRFKSGFTVVELAITIAIMVILTLLAVVNLRGNQGDARDEERETDVKNIAIHLEGIYANGIPSDPSAKGSYPTTAAVSSAANINTWFSELDNYSLRAPDVSAPSFSLIPATNNNQSVTGIRPLPTITTYVYQPRTATGALCTVAGDCRNFNIFYRLEGETTARVITSKNQ